jgi:ABC-type uncharacterized transport system ATPase subunit
MHRPYASIDAEAGAAPFRKKTFLRHICIKTLVLISIQRRVVEQLLMDCNSNQAVICNNLRKIYPGKDGNPDKMAVRGLSLALPKGQCFGMLGPNGAGKTSFISMV